MDKMNNPRWPHECVIERECDVDPYSGDDILPMVIYKGSCRSYTRHVTRGTGEVITSVRVLSIPLSTFEWDKSPLAGDNVTVKVGSTVEKGKVVDFNPNNFGTDITWRYVRN